MNTLVKSAVGSALALAAFGAHALGIPANNASDLVLVIQNEATPANVYILDTGISLSTAMAGTLVTNAVLNTSLAGVNASVAESGTLAAFLTANPLSGDGWTLEGGQYSGTSPTASPTNAATKAPGKAFGVFTSQTNPITIGQVSLAPFQGFLGGMQGDLTQPADGLGLHPLLSCGALCDASTGASFLTSAAGASSKYALFGNGISDVLVGAGSQSLFGITGNNGTGTVQSYILGSASLSASGVLTITGNSSTPVPLPAAVWLFGSGLMGLVGVSRRRKTPA
jgi:hypothetical protein